MHFSCLTDGDPYACDYMGFYAFSTFNGSRPRAWDRKLYLLTEEKKPFCSYHYRVTIVLSDTRESLIQGGDRYVRSKSTKKIELIFKKRPKYFLISKVFL